MTYNHPVLDVTDTPLLTSGVPDTTLLTSDESVSCIQDTVSTNGVESYKGTVNSYTDGTWQIVKSKKSHR
jgi:hypothetical protein